MLGKRHRFRPLLHGALEPRVVLSRNALIAPVTVSAGAIADRNSRTQAVVDQINIAFDAFKQDYLQAQGIYLISRSSDAQKAFRSFVNERTDLLASQLTRIFAKVPGSLDPLDTSSPGGPVVVQAFLRTRINGLGPNSLLQKLNGRRSSAIPPTNVSNNAATLYAEQAISAIETTRSATLNSVGFLFSQSFQKHH